RIGMQVFDAAAHFEKVESVVEKFLRGCAGREWSVVDILSGEATQSVSNRSARILILRMHLYERRKPQAQPCRIGFGKCFAQNLVQQKSRFKIRSSRRVFDRAHAIAQVQTLGTFFRRRKQSLQAPTHVRGFADVWLGGVIDSAEKKNGRSGW